MGDEFYAIYGGSAGEQQQSQSEDGRKKLTIPGGDLQTRMCNRIANTLKNTVVTRNNDDNESNNPTQPENVRIMFDVMTQDHQWADLVWNEQTRIELRSTLDW